MYTFSASTPFYLQYNGGEKTGLPYKAIVRMKYSEARQQIQNLYIVHALQVHREQPPEERKLLLQSNGTSLKATFLASDWLS